MDGSKANAFGDFPGFEKPESNYFKLPNEWTDITAKITSLAELKVVEYVLRHTWGYQEFDLVKKITTDEFMNGRKRQGGTRLDLGTGLSNRSVIDGLRLAVQHGLLVEEIDDTDKARIKKYYALRMKPQHDISKSDVKNLHTGVKILQGDVKNVHSDVKNVHSRSRQSSQRTEKETIERNSIERKNNNNPISETTSVVVDKLIALKIAPKKAQELAAKYAPEYIEEKIELLAWKREAKRAGRSISDPAAWLIRAIEKNYTLPDGFTTEQERERDDAERRRRTEALLARQEEEREELLERQRRRQQERLAELYAKYGTTQNDLEFWPHVLAYIEGAMSRATYNLWFAQTQLLSLRDGRALIGVPNPAAREWLESRLTKVIREAFANLGIWVDELAFEVL